MRCEQQVFLYRLLKLLEQAIVLQQTGQIVEERFQAIRLFEFEYINEIVKVFT
ncbi:hypothetical protein PB1_12114 [Bacillus methanolicus PB1]|uniref:Uncharacterized protein n=1 Tax=Bacillus methanolicus PB1 TaxID=997296 RepID=I3DVN4_BACMT|nr:hypothetical protein PB1_12114 [Bacillus methanolicus PB1]